jgi:hypothetical protein
LPQFTSKPSIPFELSAQKVLVLLFWKKVTSFWLFVF